MGELTFPPFFFFLFRMRAPRDIGRRLELETYLFFKWKTPVGPAGSHAAGWTQSICHALVAPLENQPSLAEARFAGRGQPAPWDTVGQAWDPWAAVEPWLGKQSVNRCGL